MTSNEPPTASPTTASTSRLRHDPPLAPATRIPLGHNRFSSAQTDRPRFGYGRFDDLRNGYATVFDSPRRLITATTPDDVPLALAMVDAATRDGDWAYGYVAYDAAPGLDASLAVPGSEQSRSVPLVAFVLGGPPRSVPVITPLRNGYGIAPWRNTLIAQQYCSAVEDIRQHIAAGEIYQCNFTTQFVSAITGDPLRCYADLVAAQRCRYGAFLDLGDHVVASASPELFFEWTANTVRTRPMKGTAPRGRTVEADERIRRRLLADPKERAENVMIVDLLRNDLSRIVGAHDVRVQSLLNAEPYPTVWQLTSEITARISAHASLTDIFAALFPCGSITGAPKHRSMQIISGLESAPRGVYCGAIGVVAPPDVPAPRARFSVAIRTITIDRNQNTAAYGAGGAITWDSSATAELAEMQTKTRILQYLNSSCDAPDRPHACGTDPSGTPSVLNV